MICVFIRECYGTCAQKYNVVFVNILIIIYILHIYLLDMDTGRVGHKILPVRMIHIILHYFVPNE